MSTIKTAALPSGTDEAPPLGTTALASLSVKDVIELPEIVAGDPQTYAEGDSLNRKVQWVHVLSGPDAIRHLDGGELILTTGAGWPTDADQLIKLTAELADAQIAAIVFELGQNFVTAPPKLIEACLTSGIPLIVLHKEIRFVQVTQRVHKLILAGQNEALSARNELHQMFTQLGLNRSPVDYVVEQIALTLGAPVILANEAREVVAWSSGNSGYDAEAVLAPWPAKGYANTASRAPVQARGTRYGWLHALPGPAHPAGRQTVLELGAFALALARLADKDGTDWLRLSSKQVLNTLLSGKYRSEVELAVQLTAHGLKLKNTEMFVFALSGMGDFGAHDTLERAVLETALRRAVAPIGQVLVTDHEIAKAASLPRTSAVSLLGVVTVLSGTTPEAVTFANGLAAKLARELEMLVPGTTPTNWRAHLAVGSGVTGVHELIAAFERLQSFGYLPTADTVGRVALQQQADQPLLYLLQDFANSPTLASYAQRTLGPLLSHDQTTGVGHYGDLVRVLECYLDTPTNRSLAAAKAKLSRSVFYGRLELIEELLGMNLNDGKNIAALYVAVASLKL